jgi:hypothetical protein
MASMAAAALLALLLALANGAMAQQRRDLGGFSIELPAALALQARGGVDSHSGRLVGAGLALDYDLGLYADPLLAREGSSAHRERELIVDGRPARLVQWQIEQPTPRLYFVGLHLRQIQPTSAGPLHLTLLAQSTDPAQVQAAQAMLLTLRISPPRPGN